MNVKYVTVPKCVDCQKDCEKADYVFFGESKVCKHGKGFIICGITPEKQKPLMSDGTLPLTKEELEEISKIIGREDVNRVDVFKGVLFYYRDSPATVEYIKHYRAIAYLLERFNLNEVKS